MRDAARCRWQQWRVALVVERPAEPVSAWFARRPVIAAPGGCAEVPGPDGIRHGLVARIRHEIEAGTYDTEERWLAAEERLLARVCGA